MDHTIWCLSGQMKTCSLGAVLCKSLFDTAFSAFTYWHLFVLHSVDVFQLACGPRHVVAVGSDGDVYTWGCAADGRLGLPGDENR